MVTRRRLQWYAPLVLWSLATSIVCSQEYPKRLWPSTPPGKITADGEERDTTEDDGRLVAGKPVIRLGHVSTPSLTVYPAPAENNTGAAVLVCPGGGYHILAYDLEGSEVCEWLNSIGVTGILLKYRVPRPQEDPRPIGPLMDAQRAMSIVRANAEKRKIDPERIGVLGFSAGGHLAARLSTVKQRAYPKIDRLDESSFRPDFSILVYPAYLFDRESDDLLASDLEIDEQTPPMFLTMAFDDRIGPDNILRMGIALHRVGVPAEVHLYPTGGHGYGLRPSEHQATTWPARCAAWMQSSGWLSE